MPVYEFECPTHGVFEEFHRMADVPRSTKCPDCGAQSDKQFFCGQTVIPPKDSGWEGENGGKGHPCHQLGRFPNDPYMYCHSRLEFKEKVKRNEQKFSED
jgi:putative FmdB family regulatory protein